MDNVNSDFCLCVSKPQATATKPEVMSFSGQEKEGIQFNRQAPLPVEKVAQKIHMFLLAQVKDQSRIRF
jgi:hypothetical protein